MSLFLKIFLWFWASMALLALSLVAFQFSSHNDFVIPPQSGMMMQTLERYSVKAVMAYADGGDAQLSAYISDVERRKGVRAYLFSIDGQELGGRNRAPDDVVELARKTALEMSPKLDLSTLRIIAATPVQDQARDRYYIFAGSIPRTLLAARRFDVPTTLLSVAFLVFTTGLFCYGLARYLAAPVGKIRKAANQIALGNLSARVEPNHFPRGRDELTSLAGDFDAMAERMESLVAAQNRLLGDVSHELRSPLTRLNLALELARRGDEPKRLSAFNRIEREATRLDSLIGELLTLSRLENGLRAETLSRIVDLSELAGEVASDADFEAQNAGRGVRVSFEAPKEALSVRGDAELLRRALENVARNAARHTQADSTVEISLQRQRDGDQDGVLWRTRDRGPGVPDEEIASIFRPFYRVENARERAETDRGTGLGLAIAERAAHAHGGRISAKNAAGGGLEVEIWLPSLREIK